MIPVYDEPGVTLYHGDCIEVMRSMPDASVHAVVTDPPYGIAFMGKAWDQPGEFGSLRKGRTRSLSMDTGGDHKGTTDRSGAMIAGDYDLSPSAMKSFQRWCEEWARECYRVLKPGGFFFSFGGSRTWHRLAAGVEDAGFEIRDSIAWLYGSGFPKSLNLEGNWDGWGTALKPAFEPIVVGRKPLGATVALTLAEHGTGALNIDATRIHTEGSEAKSYNVKRLKPGATLNETGGNWRPDGDDAVRFEGTTRAGRWPTNVLMDESQAESLDSQTGVLTSGMMRAGVERAPRDGVIYGKLEGDTTSRDTYGDSGGASRFFPVFPTMHYEAKAPSIERPDVDGIQHPTVKPLELMRWLVRLVASPGAVILEPFAGSGTTLEACLLEGFDVIGIEREDIYLPLIMQRIRKPLQQSLFGDIA